MGLYGSFYSDLFGGLYGDGDGEVADIPDGPEVDAPIVARMLSRIVTRFRTPKRIAYMRQIAKPAGELVDIFLAIINSAGIDGCTGFQLDVIGKLVGQPRQGLTDTDYRRYLRARIAANCSNTTVNVIYKIARLVIDDAAVNLEIVQDGTASYSLLVGGAPVDAATIAALGVLVRAATAAGVRVWLEVTTVADTDVAMTGLDTVVTVNDSIGSLVLHADTTGFPDSGSLVIEAGDISGGKEETVSYTSRLASSFNLSAPLTKTHNLGAIAYLAVSDGRPVSESAQTTPGTITVGATTITVDDTTGFPTSGTIDIDAGTDLWETLPYASKTSTTFVLSLGSATAFAHLQGAMVDSVDDGGALDDAMLI